MYTKVRKQEYQIIESDKLKNHLNGKASPELTPN